MTFCDDVGIPAHYAATIAELIQTQLDEARNLAAISVVDPDVTEDDVVWSEEEKEEESHIEEATTEIEGENEAEAMEVDGKVSAAATPQVEVDEEEAEEEQEDVYVHKVWPEADCRIVINVSIPEFWARHAAEQASARRADIRAYPSRPDRMGSFIHSATECLCQALLQRDRSHWRGHPSRRARHHR